MTLGDRLKQLRRDLHLSQEAFGAQGFVSAPGWIKMENGDRQPSERLIARLCRWLVDDKHLRLAAANTLQDELLTLKYLGSRSPFVRGLAWDYASDRPALRALRGDSPDASLAPRVKPKRGRPKGAV